MNEGKAIRSIENKKRHKSGLCNQHLTGRVLFGMPKGPPFGGMTVYTSMILESSLFQKREAIYFDTTPKGSKQFIRRILHFLVILCRLIGLICRNRIQVAYFMTSDFFGFYEKAIFALICRTFGAKVVLHFIGEFRPFYNEAGRSRKLIEFLLRRMDGLIVVNEAAKNIMNKIISQDWVWFVPNPVKYEDYNQLQSKKFESGTVKILFSGLVDRDKGILDLLEVFSRYKHQFSKTQLIIMGSGPLLKECQNIIARQGLETIVTATGFVDESTKKQLYRSSDIYVLPSYSEGIPLSVLEAMAAGLPVVTTNVGGIPSVISNDVEGYLVEPGDIEQIADRLKKLVKQPAIRATMGLRAAERVKCFGMPVIIAKLGQILNTLIAKH